MMYSFNTSLHDLEIGIYLQTAARELKLPIETGLESGVLAPQILLNE
jgi:hypothetical protein